jgi:tetratricopeptide (TPR) repeat protein
MEQWNNGTMKQWAMRSLPSVGTSNKTMKCAIVFLFSILLSIPGISQKYLSLKTYNVDSLLLILPDQIGEERVNSLNSLAVSLFFIDYEASKQYADEAMNLAKNVNYEKGIADAYRNYGHIYVYQGKFPQSLNNLLESLSLYEKLDEKHLAATVLYEVARLHYFARNYEKAAEYCFKSLDKFRKRSEEGTTVGNVKDTISVYLGLALVYRLMHNHDQALKFSLLVGNVMRDNLYDDTERLLNLWATGAVYSSVDLHDSAKVYFLETLSFPDENQNIQALKFRSVSSLGYIHIREGNMDSAYYYLQKAYAWYKKNGFLYWATWTGTALGYLCFENGELEIAESYYQEAESHFNEMLEKNSWISHDSLKHIITFGTELYFPMPLVQMKRMIWAEGSIIYYYLYKINEIKNRTNEALKYHIAYSDANDTVDFLRRNSETIELQTRFEEKQGEEQIAFLAQENEFKAYKLNQSKLFLFGLICLVILIIIIAVIIIRMNKIRDREHSLLLQQKLFRSQMNPHFLFNSLVSIQNFIVNQEPIKAGKYLSKFSKLVRNILDSSFEEYVPLEEELHTIKNYLELQKVRYSDRFDYLIEVDETIDTESIKIPPMLAQPIIENAIEHGIKHKDSGGHIIIRFLLKNGHIVFEVEDDGVGRKKAMEIMLALDRDHKSIATAITHERIQVLNKRLKKKITMQVEDLMDDHDEPTGTRVVFEIPVLDSSR